MNHETIIAALLCALVLLTPLSVVATDAGSKDRIRPYTENPYYWQYKGKPVLLLGGSDDDNLFQWSEKDLVAQLDRLAAAGGNVIRNTMSDRKDKGFEVYPFKRRSDGKYDLNDWNQEYWTRFERMLRETAKRDIIVQVEMWDRFDYSDAGGGNRWQIHPYNPKNNVNYTYEQSGFARRYPDHPGANKQPFFFTTPKQRHNRVVLTYQQRFVQKMLDHTLRYDHVLYCVDNETSGEEEWGRYWATFIRQAAAKRGTQAEVTEMWDDWNVNHPRHGATIDHPEIYTFIDVSQNNTQKGQAHYDNPQQVRQRIKDHPRPINNTKIYGADTGRFGNSRDGVERFWRNIFGGLASARFHRPDSGLGLGKLAQQMIRSARQVTNAIDIFTCQPSNDLLTDREANEAYCLARPPSQYAVYFPAAGQVTLKLVPNAQQRRLQWFDIDTGKWHKPQPVKAGSMPLKTPGSGQWAVVITQQSSP